VRRRRLRQRAAERDAVACGQRAEPEQGEREARLAERRMRAQAMGAAARLAVVEVEARGERDELARAQALEQGERLVVATEPDVLPVVDRVAHPGVRPRGRAAAPVAAGLEQGHALAADRELERGRDACVAAADDEHTAPGVHRASAFARATRSALSSQGVRTRSRQMRPGSASIRASTPSYTPPMPSAGREVARGAGGRAARARANEDARAGGERAGEPACAVRRRRPGKRRRIDAERLEVRARHVDAARARVGGNVAQHVRALQRDAEARAKGTASSRPKTGSAATPGPPPTHRQ
jgi:hypothetical protein